MQRLFELSDAEVSKLFPYLADLLESDPEEHIRPRWNLLQSLLGEWAAGLCGTAQCFHCWLNYAPLH
jgi:hypothetical protein